MEILTRPQLPRAKIAAPGQAPVAGAAVSGPGNGQPNDAAAGRTGDGAQDAAGQAAQQATAAGVRSYESATSVVKSYGAWLLNLHAFLILQAIAAAL